MYATRLWGVAHSEIRSSLRLVRTWLFVIIALFVSASTTANLSVSFSMFGPNGPAAGTFVNTHYMFANQIASLLIIVLWIGTAFLLFDVNTRDKSARIQEVLDSRPMDNFGYLLGRALGVTLLMTVIATVITSLLVGVLLTLDLATDIPVAVPDLYFFASFILLDLVPILLLFSAIVVILAMILRFKVFALLVSIGFVVLLFWLQFNVPVYLLLLLFPITAALEFPSDLTPFFTSGMVLLQRIAMLAGALGLIGFASTLRSRPDGPRSRRDLIGGFALTAVFAVGFYLIYLQFVNQTSDEQRWAQHHKQAFDVHGVNQLDVKRLEGSVVIDPGSQLTLEVSLSTEVLTQESGPLLLSLNPGYDIASVKVEGREASFDFTDGLIEITHDGDLSAGQRIDIDILASGEPLPGFAHLDSSLAVGLDSEISFASATIFLLGEESSIFHSDYVALMPGDAWYPVPGPNVARDRTAVRTQDFFELDLEVELPDNWLVAGPGKREQISTNRYQFSPKVQVPHFALLADEFVSRSAAIEGIEFEVLFHPRHETNLEVFADIAPVLQDQIGETLTRAQQIGLPYPYGAFTIVEIPLDLRVFDGGWRMDTVLGMPGMAMVREVGFPTTRFDQAVDYSLLEWDDERRDLHKTALLRRYFQNDVYGGNVELAFAKNLLIYQTQSSGEGSEALNSVLASLVFKSVLPESQGFFNVFFASSQVSASWMVATPPGFTEEPVSHVAQLRTNYFNSSKSWEAAETQTLLALPYDDEPRQALDVIEVKASKLADAIAFGLPSEDVSQLLALVKERFAGEVFSFDEFMGLVYELELPIANFVDGVFHSTQLPGFEVSDAVVARVRDDQNGLPRYQTSVKIYNGELVPGLFSISYNLAAKGDSSDWVEDSVPTQFLGAREAKQINIVTSEPIAELYLDPYLSLNRNEVAINILKRRQYPIQDQEPLDLVIEGIQFHDNEDIIVIDDLDQGFVPSGNEDTAIPWFAQSVFQAAVGDLDTDKGLPTGFSATIHQGTHWVRYSTDSSYGKYRKTYVRTAARGAQDEEGKLMEATFTTDLPHDGWWRLEYHMPRKAKWKRGGGAEIQVYVGPGSANIQGGALRELSVIPMELRYGANETHRTEFDADAADGGNWNLIGTYQLPAGETVLAVSNTLEDTDPDGLIVADAVRFIPVEGGGGSGNALTTFAR